ncbi:von Willebrand factor-like [Clavelina lepadiformis]|uniref:von Willebrand factor-like n=1 Tax=Clavelina lepadiformis TaxID=159417 RepID=UPI0040421B4E
MDETRRRKLKQSILLFVIVVSLYAGLSSSIESFSVDEAENLEHVIDIEKRQANGVSLTPHADVTTVNPRTDSCDLPCMNGGRCIGRNICHCYHPFSGYRCLYGSDFSMDHTEVVDLEADISTKMCSLFGPGNILTFDGLFYDFPGLCQYEMVSSAGQPDFKILVRKNPNCAQNGQYVYDTGLCNVKITIYAAASQVKFTITDTEVTFQNKPIALPHDENGVILMKIWPYTTFILGDLTLRYDHTSGSVGVILLSDTYQNKTFGLCGNFNGISSDDLVTRQGATVSGGVKGHIVAKTWIERDVNENCLDVAMLEENIDECRERSDVTRICNILWSYFTDCHHHLNPSKFYDVCKTELCRCNYTIRADCQCEVITLYSRHCAIAGGKVTDWRTDSRCPRSCSYEQVWQECGKESPQTCEMPHLLPNQPCFDRCQCSVGLYEHGTQCTILPNCPCVHRNVEYKPGDVTSIYNCNECICNAGQWDCSIAMCPGQAHVVGFDHFKTYDDKFFTFPGRCQYIFSEDCVDGTFTMYIENTECGTDAGISCIKSFTIKFTIKGQRQASRDLM